MICVSGNGTSTFEIDVNPFEVLVVTAIVIVWLCAIAVFVHKWKALRISNPADRRFNYKPKFKNLHTIQVKFDNKCNTIIYTFLATNMLFNYFVVFQVIKCRADSVIHRTHTVKYNTTLAARNRRLHRMKTMPEIKLDFCPGEDEPLYQPFNKESVDECTLDEVSISHQPQKANITKKRSMSLPYIDNTHKLIQEPFMEVIEEDNNELDKQEY